jgi:1L-myo-inositol 1-phosphate cytidylyltransferase / CDP-L-myo-inositol myo-inositolphosphotransferase
VIDRLLHRRCSRWLTRLLILAPVTPNQVSLASLAVGCAAIWCFWRATAASAVAGVVLYALASIVDHSDGEVARLTFQESAFGAHLDWAIDTIIHAGMVLAMGVTAGGPVLAIAGVLGSAGVILSAWFARRLPRQVGRSPWAGGAIEAVGNRDLFYLVIVVFALSRWLLRSLLGPLALLVTAGSQAYWIGCVARIRAACRAAVS